MDYWVGMKIWGCGRKIFVCVLVRVFHVIYQKFMNIKKKVGIFKEIVKSKHDLGYSIQKKNLLDPSFQMV